MGIDIGILILLSVFGLFGLISGAIKQLAHWAGLAIGYLVARPLAAHFSPQIAARLGFPGVAVNVGLSVLFFFCLYLGGTIVAHFVLKKVKGKILRQKMVS